ncbi:unnamed protein product [Closterium sp. NIES-54]
MLAELASLDVTLSGALAEKASDVGPTRMSERNRSSIRKSSAFPDSRQPFTRIALLWLGKPARDRGSAKTNQAIKVVSLPFGKPEAARGRSLKLGARPGRAHLGKGRMCCAGQGMSSFLAVGGRGVCGRQQAKFIHVTYTPRAAGNACAGEGKGWREEKLLKKLALIGKGLTSPSTVAATTSKRPWAQRFTP